MSDLSTEEEAAKTADISVAVEIAVLAFSTAAGLVFSLLFSLHFFLWQGSIVVAIFVFLTTFLFVMIQRLEQFRRTTKTPSLGPNLTLSYAAFVAVMTVALGGSWTWPAALFGVAALFLLARDVKRGRDG